MDGQIPNKNVDVQQEPIDSLAVAMKRTKWTAHSAENADVQNADAPHLSAIDKELSPDEDAKRAAALNKPEVNRTVEQPQDEKRNGRNAVEADEIFTAAQTEVRPIVPSEIEQECLRIGSKFYHPKDTKAVLFEDKGNKLETKSNSEQIAEWMVRIAEARGWDEIKVSGSETFRREVWLEAAGRGMHVKGYTPSEQDKVELAKRTRKTYATNVDKDKRTLRGDRSIRSEESGLPSKSLDVELEETLRQEEDEKGATKYPALAGANAAIAAIEEQTEADGLSFRQRAVVMARVRQNIIYSVAHDNASRVKAKESIEETLEANEEPEQTR